MVWSLRKKVTELAIGILTLAALTHWLPAEAQQPAEKVYRIGFLRVVACAGEDKNLGGPMDVLLGLRALGYSERHNLVIECRSALGKAEFADLAAELVRLKVDVLVSETTKLTLAAKQATKAIPIVMIYVGDPVSSGIVDSLATPGGNITGLSANLNETIAKHLQILKEVAPRIAHVGLLMDSTNFGQTQLAEQLDVAAKAMGVRVQRLDILTPAALDGSFAAAQRQQAEALIVLPLPAIGLPDFRRIAGFAVKNGLPTITYHTPYLQAGLLILYGANMADQYRHAGSYVDKILRGAKPADLPVEQPTKIDLTINRRTARALGLKIPETLLERADLILD